MFNERKMAGRGSSQRTRLSNSADLPNYSIRWLIDSMNRLAEKRRKGDKPMLCYDKEMVRSRNQHIENILRIGCYVYKNNSNGIYWPLYRNVVNKEENSHKDSACLGYVERRSCDIYIHAQQVGWCLKTTMVEGVISSWSDSEAHNWGLQTKPKECSNVFSDLPHNFGNFNMENITK